MKDKSPNTKIIVLKPIQKEGDCPVTFNELDIPQIIEYSSSYPYFIQFFCRETFDLIPQQIKLGVERPAVRISDFVESWILAFTPADGAELQTDKEGF